MVKNAQLLYVTSQCDQVMVYGHAMPIVMPWVICDDGTRILAHIGKFRGISVPIFKGSPPIMTE